MTCCVNKAHLINNQTMHASCLIIVELKQSFEFLKRRINAVTQGMFTLSRPEIFAQVIHN